LYNLSFSLALFCYVLCSFLQNEPSMANGLGDSRTEISSALLSLFHEITKMVHAMVGNLTEQSEL
ncbi:Os03g0160000, partial [Oryza sativa Japonica Group]